LAEPEAAGAASRCANEERRLLRRHSLLRGAFDHRRALLGDHDRRRVGVGRGDPGITAARLSALDSAAGTAARKMDGLGGAAQFPRG